MRSLCDGRSIHLLDIENLTASSLPTTAEVGQTMNEYREHVPIGPMDQFIVAVNPRSMVNVGIAIRGVQLLIRSGADGADRALVEAAVSGRIDLRFERVVIGSGDGYFADLAAWLAAAGLHVTVVSRPASLNWRLYAAAGDITYLPPALALAA
ncbi:hypothetical protein OIE13_31600 [Streptosporangium sp. NBC_01810]|uniref:hypothetical protein n=1 Tax=Streptosporangium sp. NBC_01810 TaxID=2975951 RepID=UPI002DD8E35E|nr:hypothetical protein [Streptosporangium sp. NBC_01810]WSA25417.1 hypothetical protein OIE13_31600 [Streptosporangium sp. NBC_01810]